MNYKTSDFDYYLPPELIAQEPVKPRDHSRLLVLDRNKKSLEHHYFYEIINYLEAGDLLVLNNSKVFPARLIGHKFPSGGRMEVFLHHHLNKNENKFQKFNSYLKIKNNKIDQSNIWECLLRGKVKLGQIINFSEDLQAEVCQNNDDGTHYLMFNFSGDKFWSIINKIGEVPLPPYIKRLEQKNSDQEDYQTVFAQDNKRGSVAAPTAGLHFTKELLKKIKEKGVNIEYLSLHVGLGTFAPIKTENISDHKMHSEFVEISAETQKIILETRKSGKRVVAVGTTVSRSLESLNWEEIKEENKISKKSFWTDIFIYPGYQFKVVDALITNFHLPKSTLLLLVSALANQKIIKEAYQEAIRHKYRFFSYGDALLIF